MKINVGVKSVIRIFSALLILTTLACVTKQKVVTKNSREPAAKIRKNIVGYLYHFKGARLRDTPSYVNVINLAFKEADLSLDRAEKIPELVKEIDEFKVQNPKVKIMLSVGGWGSEPTWERLNAENLSLYVQNNHFDGVDIDYEPENPNCKRQSGQTSCASDNKFISIVHRLRAALPQQYKLSAAMWANGAFGEGIFRQSFPISQYTGVSLKPLRKVGRLLDFINLMAYEMPIGFDPKESMRAYRSVYSGPINVGMQVVTESKKHSPTIEEVKEVAKFTLSDPDYGVMIWYLNAKNNPPHPSAQQVSSTVCEIYGLAECHAWYPATDPGTH